MLAQVHSLKDEQAGDLRLDLEDALAQNEAARTAARGSAYNNILNELIRREESEYGRAQDERDYAFRLAQAQQEQENWQKEFELKLAAAQKSAAKSGGSGSGSSAAQTALSDNAFMDEQRFAELYKAMNSLRWSVLPGESNPTPRIREWQSAYLQTFSKYLSPSSTSSWLRCICNGGGRKAYVHGNARRLQGALCAHRRAPQGERGAASSAQGGYQPAHGPHRAAGEKINMLANSMRALTRALWGVAGAVITALLGFFFWYVQSL